jgi:hypothetical protein
VARNVIGRLHLEQIRTGGPSFAVLIIAKMPREGRQIRRMPRMVHPGGTTGHYRNLAGSLAMRRGRRLRPRSVTIAVVWIARLMVRRAQHCPRVEVSRVFNFGLCAPHSSTAIAWRANAQNFSICRTTREATRHKLAGGATVSGLSGRHPSRRTRTVARDPAGSRRQAIVLRLMAIAIFGFALVASCVTFKIVAGVRHLPQTEAHAIPLLLDMGDWE